MSDSYYSVVDISLYFNSNINKFQDICGQNVTFLLYWWQIMASPDDTFQVDLQALLSW